MKDEIFKERIGYIAGFLALVISLNSFKTELERLRINLVFISFNLAEYFLFVILAIILALHFFYLPHFIPTENRRWVKLKNVLTIISYAILFLIAINPLVLGLFFGISKIVVWLNHNVEAQRTTIKGLAIISAIIVGGIGGLVGNFIFQIFKRKFLTPNDNK
jgi:hypothetical protein